MPALIDKSSYLCPPPSPHHPQSFLFPFLVTKPIHIWNSYRDSGQRVLAILSLSAVVSRHSLNTKCDCIWAVLKIKSADVVLHKHGISATSWITLFHACAKKNSNPAYHSLPQAWLPAWLEGGSGRRASCCWSQNLSPFPAVALKGHQTNGDNVRRAQGSLPSGENEAHHPSFHPCLLWSFCHFYT